jgi:hypothetical protein
VAGGDFHRGLVGFDGQQGLFRLDGVAGLDQQFDDGDFLEVPDVGDLHFDQCHVFLFSAARTRAFSLIDGDFQA